ncbi:MAG: hypothetical protein ABIT38_02670 [Gemmatimonadaceae bacterium]
MHHLRMPDGRREEDLSVERADYRVVALEVMRSASVEDRDLRPLTGTRSGSAKIF